MGGGARARRGAHGKRQIPIPLKRPNLNMYFCIFNHSINFFNESNSLIYTFFLGWFCKIFFHLIANGYEGFDLIISLVNKSHIFTFRVFQLKFIKFCLILWCFFRFWIYYSTSLLFAEIIFFLGCILWYSFHAHIFTTLHILRHL